VSHITISEGGWSMTPSKTPSSQSTPGAVPLFSSHMPLTRAAGTTGKDEELKRLNRWQSWAAFPVAFAGILFVTRPSSARAVLIYRIALIAVGVTTYVVLALKKRRIRK